MKDRYSALMMLYSGSAECNLSQILISILPSPTPSRSRPKSSFFSLSIPPLNLVLLTSSPVLNPRPSQSQFNPYPHLVNPASVVNPHPSNPAPVLNLIPINSTAAVLHPHPFPLLNFYIPISSLNHTFFNLATLTANHHSFKFRPVF